MQDNLTPYALVADDDPLLRMDASDILQEAGFRVHEAAGYDDAVSILKEAGASIQLLFTDVQMPPGQMNGFHLARHCARDWPDIKILVASGQIKPGPGDMPDGAVFVSKPFSSKVIHDRLQELLPDGQKPEPLLKMAHRSTRS
ncbi:response regulator [Rhizobium sp. CFBP 8762]|uniref:response regulator n=1 Tax=Rhizobium sp. CFBP 8762 TaxID=2775279 RepID=UPI00177DFB12|nr:response regulator [Rhizobium sp. CFBP 8762]MBD8555089.1 response regulator [Rhizobium sp. CFBP 8762]